MLWPKKNSYKESDNEKKFLRLENSPPPHKFSNGPSLTNVTYYVKVEKFSSFRLQVSNCTQKGNSRFLNLFSMVIR